jgi:hypothetical protein
VYESVAKNLTKQNLLEKFDTIFNKELRKLSVQEFNKNPIENYINQTVRGFTSVIIPEGELDYLRNKNKFLNDIKQ